MSCIIYQTNKENGNVYAYESVSYRDPVTKKPRSKRTYLGRVDPDTKMIIPKAKDGKRNRSKNSGRDGMLPDEIIREMDEQKKQIQTLQEKVTELSRKNKNNVALIKKMKQLLDTYE